MSTQSGNIESLQDFFLRKFFNVKKRYVFLISPKRYKVELYLFLLIIMMIYDYSVFCTLKSASKEVRLALLEEFFKFLTRRHHCSA